MVRTSLIAFAFLLSFAPTQNAMAGGRSPHALNPANMQQRWRNATGNRSVSASRQWYRQQQASRSVPASSKPATSSKPKSKPAPKLAKNRLASLKRKNTLELVDGLKAASKKLPPGVASNIRVAATALSQADFARTGNRADKRKQSNAWKRLVLASYLVEKISLEGFLGGNEESEATYESLREFLSNSSSLREGLSQLSKSLEKHWKANGQASFEAWMGLEIKKDRAVRQAD